MRTLSNYFALQTTFQHEQYSVGEDGEKRRLEGVAGT